MKRFIAPTSVISWSAPKSQRHWWQPCCSAIFCVHRVGAELDPILVNPQPPGQARTY